MSKIAARGGAVDAGAVDAGAVRGGAVDAGAVDAGAVDGGAVRPFSVLAAPFEVMDFIIDQRAARIAAIRETLRPDAEVRAACPVTAGDAPRDEPLRPCLGRGARLSRQPGR